MTNSKSLYRLGGIAAILGGAITQVSGAMHPVETATIFDPAVHMHEIAANPVWSGVFFGFSIGFLCLLAGLTAIASALEPGWAAIARQVATVTTAIALIFFIVDGFTAKTIATAVVASHDNQAVVAAAAAFDRFGRMYFGQWTFLSWGVTPFLFGVAVMKSTSFKKWLGIFPVLSGLCAMTVGVVHDFNDFSLGLLPGFYIAVLVFNLWMIAMGVMLIRKASMLAA